MEEKDYILASVGYRKLRQPHPVRLQLTENEMILGNEPYFVLLAHSVGL